MWTLRYAGRCRVVKGDRLYSKVVKKPVFLVFGTSSPSTPRNVAALMVVPRHHLLLALALALALASAPAHAEREM